MRKMTIEGRVFVPIKNGTFAHDIWVSRKVREAGLTSLKLEDGETQDEFMDRLSALAWESGSILDLLGGLLIPDGLKASDWTPEISKQTAEFFGNVTEEDSKRELRMQIGGVLFYFFLNGLASSKTSPRSGTENREGEPQENEAASTTEIGDI